MPAILEMAMATHGGTTTEEFEAIVTDWITTATHPKTGRLYTDMVYQPMLELLAYLHANGFRTFIVSGGGIEFALTGSNYKDIAAAADKIGITELHATAGGVRFALEHAPFFVY